MHIFSPSFFRHFTHLAPYVQEHDAISRDLHEAHLDLSSREFLSAVLIMSCGVTLFLTALFLSVGYSLSLALAYALLGGVTTFVFFRFWIVSEKRRVAREAEAELPFFLRTIAQNLTLRRPFERAFPRHTKIGALLHAEIRRHHSVTKALIECARAFDSTLVRRAFSHLAFVYTHGKGEELLRSMADEVVEIHKERFREHAAKMTVMGLLFISGACIVPALFHAYVTIGSSVFSFSFSPFDIYLIYLVGFPLLDVVLIAAMISTVPSFIETKRSPFLSPEERTLLNATYERYLPWLSSTLSLKKFMVVVFLLSLLIALALFEGVFRGAVTFLSVGAVLMTLSLPLIVYLFLSYLAEERIRSMEYFLPHALFHAASFPSGYPFEKIFSSLSKGQYGELSVEFQKMYYEIRAGGNVVEALKQFEQRNPSLLISRAVQLLRLAYFGGRDMAQTMRETAEDVFSLFSLLRERKSVLSMQKYTLLFGGALIVPVVMGSVSGVMGAFPGNEEIHAAGKTAMQLYLVIYVLLASIVVAEQEGTRRKFLVYFLTLAPLALILFSLASLGIISF